MQGAATKHEEVPNLVEAEKARKRVWFFRCIHNGAERVRHAARDDERKCESRQRTKCRGAFDHDEPTHGNVHGRVQRSRRAHPRDAHRNAKNGKHPKRSQHEVPRRAVERAPEHRRAGAGNEKKDGRMIELAQPLRQALAAQNEVIRRACGVEQHERDRVGNGWEKHVAVA